MITLVLTVFVIIPEVLAADWSGTGARKKMLPVEEYYAYNLKVMWDFEGILRYSPIFYGYYSDKTQTSAGYRSCFALTLRVHEMAARWPYEFV